MTVSSNVTRHANSVTPEERARLIGQSGRVVWLTGLSGSEKNQRLLWRRRKCFLEAGCFSYVLDGDNLRHGLCGDLGFSQVDRAENIRRVGEVARLFYNAGAIVLCAFVSPDAAARQAIRTRFPDGHFIEVYIATPLDVCEARDPKALYERARAGKIKDFTGITAPYDVPERPELKIDTSKEDVGQAAQSVLDAIHRSHTH